MLQWVCYTDNLVSNVDVTINNTYCSAKTNDWDFVTTSKTECWHSHLYNYLLDDVDLK